MKKMLSLLAAAALTASLAGCGASKSYASASRPAAAEAAEGAYGVSDSLDTGFDGSGESAAPPPSLAAIWKAAAATAAPKTATAAPTIPTAFPPRIIRSF